MFKMMQNIVPLNRLILLANIVLMVCSRKMLGQSSAFSQNDIENNVSRDTRNRERINLSVPGTKWCGPGNTASNYDDLGNHADVDMCCRDHDHCDHIPAGETKYNLTNDDHFTVLHCDCDKEFYKCLHTIDSHVSNQIGHMYFTLRDHCYRNDYPKIECAEYETALFLRRCIRYVTDETQPMRYQWFDLPLYYGKSTRDHAEYDFENMI